MNKLHFLWLMVVVLLLAAVLRIYNIDAQGLWGDEGWSVEFSENPNPQAVTLAVVPDLHPPLYFIALAQWRTVAGDSELALRLPAVFAALLTVALVSRLTSQPLAGIFGALVLAIADKHIVLSQEARHYPVAFMMMAFSSWLYFQWLRRPTTSRTLFFAVSIVVSLYVHYYTGLIVAVQILHCGLVYRSRLRSLMVLTTLSVLAFLPWFFVAIYQLQLRPEGILHSMPLNMATFEFLTIDFLGRPPMLLGTLVLLGIFYAVRNSTSRSIYAALWLVVPLAITIIVYPVVTLVTDRNMALLLVPIALLAGHGMASFKVSSAWLLAGLIVVNGLFSLDSYEKRPPWRAMAAYIATHYPADEPVFMDVVGGDKALGYHLRQDLPADTDIVSLNQVRIDHGVYFLGIWDEFLRENDGFWIAYWVNEDRHWDALEPMLAQGYTRTATERMYHVGNPIDLYHFDRLPEIDERLTDFGDVIRLHRVKFPHEVEATMTVSMWWSTRELLPVSYSVSVFLLDGNGRLVAQHDGAPQNGQAPTADWLIDEIVFDSHQIDLSNVEPGTYQLAIKIYDSAAGTVLFAGQNQNEYFIVDTMFVN